MTGDPMIEVEELRVRYGGREVLQGVSLAVASGEVLALLGRNGEGKTSLIRCLLGLQCAAGGSARILGTDSWSARAEVMREVGYVPERPQAPSWRTARQLLAWGGAFYSEWEGERSLERLEANGVPLDLPLAKLSQGQRKQVEIAFALASRPRVLVLDDPALGLDPTARRALWAGLAEDLAEGGVAVLLVTHELEAVERIADRVAILADGRVLVDEPLGDLRERFRRLPLEAELPSEEALESLGTVTTAWGRRRVVTRWPGDAAAGALATRAEAMSLEEIFESLVGGGS